MQYDTWSRHPGNDAQTTQFLQASEFSSLGSIQYPIWGITPNQGGEEEWLNSDTQHRAAAALWLRLTKALSTDPGNPDFFRRLNAQLIADNVTNADGPDRAYRNILEEIQKVAGNATIEGLRATDWLGNHALLNGTINNANSTGCPNPGGDQIVIYKDANFTGDCRVLNVGTYASSSAFGLPNDSISSVKVGQSVRAVLFQDDNCTGEQSLYEPGSYAVMGRNENDQVSSILVTYNHGSRAASRYLGNNPSRMWTEWAFAAQGLAHDNTSWYVTQKSYINKYDIGADLSTSPKKWVGIPSQLSQRGCDHFGDPDFANGYLLVPVEGCKNSSGAIVYLAVFDSQLNLICYDDLYQQENTPDGTNAGWVAVDPITGYLYSSGYSLNSVSLLHTYRIDWTAIFSDVNPHWFLYDTNIGNRRLVRQDGTSVDLKTIQGGVFSGDGRLFYLTSGANSCDVSSDGADRGGLRVFDAATGILIAKAGNGYGYFDYENHCGFSDYEEPEGLDYVDMSVRPGPYYGQLHVLLTQTPASNAGACIVTLGGVICPNNVYLKHFGQF